MTTGFISAVLDGLMAAITLVMMFVYRATLASVVLASALLYGLLRMAAYRPLREASMEGMILGAQEQSCFLETIRAIQAINLAGREIDRRTRWLNLLAQSVNRGIRTQKLGLVFGNLHLAVTGIVGALVWGDLHPATASPGASTGHGGTSSGDVLGAPGSHTARGNSGGKEEKLQPKKMIKPVLFFKPPTWSPA